MSVLRKPKSGVKLLTVAEYLEIERKAEYKSEFYDGIMVPLHHPTPEGMAGASKWHNSVKDNLIIEVGSRLKKSPCRTFSSDQRVQTSPTVRYSYPDIVIVCGKPEFSEIDPDSLTNPQIVFEVLSPSTENLDRGFKFAGYQHQPSLREYVLVAQDEARIERYVRQPNGTWNMTIFEGLDGTFALDSIPVEIAMADIYADVEFCEAGSEESP